MLDDDLRRRRTISESKMITLAKEFGLRTPYIYFVDPFRAEIVMEFISGTRASKVLTSSICNEIGRFVSTLHLFNIIHGDLTPANFIVNRKITMIDMGLSFHSTRREDKVYGHKIIQGNSEEVLIIAIVLNFSVISWMGINLSTQRNWIKFCRG